MEELVDKAQKLQLQPDALLEAEIRNLKKCRD